MDRDGRSIFGADSKDFFLILQRLQLKSTQGVCAKHSSVIFCQEYTLLALEALHTFSQTSLSHCRSTKALLFFFLPVENSQFSGSGTKKVIGQLGHLEGLGKALYGEKIRKKCIP